MTRGTRARYVVGAVLGTVTAVLAGYGVAGVWGLTVEYGAGLQLLPIAVLVPALLGALTLQVWPGLSNRTMLLAPLALGLVLAGAGLVADRVGLHHREVRAAAASESIGCNGPNSEITVDARVDEVFAELPRPTHLHGPIEGSRYGCGAGVDGGAKAFEQWSQALRGLPGYEVVHDRPRVLAVRREDGITVVLRRGAVPVLTVSTREGTDLGDAPRQDGVVVGRSVASAWRPASRNPTER